MGDRVTAVRGILTALAVAGATWSGVAAQERRGEATRGGEGEELRGDQAGQSGRFGRMFHLPPFAEPTPAIKAALARLGARGGRLDAHDNVAAGPVALILDPALNTGNPNNDAHSAGMTFVGQFLDHDMTFDTASRLGRPTNPRRSPNARRPYFDLDSVYGDGPAGSPQLYEPADRAKFRVESGGIYEDLPREPSGRAIIADPRNDETVVIAGLQAAMLQAHHHAVDLARQADPPIDDDAAFQTARRLLTWHYQWMIVHEFLPQLVGPAMIGQVLGQPHRRYHPQLGDAYMPVEFQIAYRMGHSMVRPSYRANFTGLGGAPFFALIFDPSQEGAADPSDLRGGVRGARRFVGWSTFFAFPGLEADVRPNKRLDTHLSTPLFELPLGAIAGGAPPISLAERNLLRHLTWSVPSGQAIAAAIGAPVLTPAQLSELAAFHPRFVTSTPLWYYVLKEAEVSATGARLGPVGGYLVAEVFLGLLQSDPDAYVNEQPDFQPTWGAVPGDFRMIDLLNFAGVGGRR
jgi:hypothetical protein